jgi:H+/gluconate symporter-like permease
MNKEQLGGILRAVLAAGAGYAVGKGIIDQGTADAVVGGLVTIGVAVWSFVSNKQEPWR